MDRVLAPLLFALLLSVPALATANAPSEADSVTVHVAPFHAGDVVRYHDDGTGTYREVEVLGEGFTIDRFGQEVAVTSYRRVNVEDGERTRDWTCHHYGDSATVARRDLGEGGPGRPGKAGRDYDGPTVLPTREVDYNLSNVADFPDGCMFWLEGRSLLGERTLRAGDRLSYSRDVAPSAPDGLAETRSGPALATTFHGRDALVFPFNLTPEGQAPHLTRQPAAGARPVYALTVADGLPGAVAWGVAWVDAAGALVTPPAWDDLTAYRPGDGDPVRTTREPVEVPARHPDAAFAVAERLRLDDAALGLPFPYDEAYEGALLDPQSGLRAWLDEHPDAHLVGAHYDRHMRDRWTLSPNLGDQETRETDGGWEMTFATDREAYEVTVVRVTGVVGPEGVGTVEAPAKVIRTTRTRSHDTGVSLPDAPPTVLTSDGLATLGRGHGIQPEDVAVVGYGRSVDENGAAHTWFTLSDVASGYNPEEGSTTGRILVIDGDTGAVERVYANARQARDRAALEGYAFPARTGPPAPQAPDDHTLTSHQAPLATGEGLQADAPTAWIATGVAGATLLALAVKFLLIPFYTRLRRSQLLHHPTRARLVAHVRAHPGVHLAELQRVANVGKSTTQHHVDQLVRHGILRQVRDGKFLRYHAAGALAPSEAEREAILRAGSNRAVHDAYAAQPDLSLREAARRLGLSAPTVHRAKKRLEKAGLLPAAPAANRTER